MFTGLVEIVGVLAGVVATDAGIELRIECAYDDLTDGESVALNGPCLTVLEAGEGWFTVAAMTVTTARTTIADWKPGQRVNLERAVRADGRLGGHIVQGHVDGVGTVTAITHLDDSRLLDITIPPDLSKTLVLHGSVAIDGVSLTVNGLQGDKLQVALIDYTLRNTTLGELEKGSRVNVETDVIGKYIRHLAAPYIDQ